MCGVALFKVGIDWVGGGDLALDSHNPVAIIASFLCEVGYNLSERARRRSHEAHAD
jgi:hypothetical protein